MNDNIIRFPGVTKGPVQPQGAPAPPKQAVDDPKPGVMVDVGTLAEDQQKAISLILAGKAFVFVAITPTDRGADFHTALHGEPSDLRNAQPHLDRVITKLYDRKGV